MAEQQNGSDALKIDCRRMHRLGDWRVDANSRIGHNLVLWILRDGQRKLSVRHHARRRGQLYRGVRHFRGNDDQRHWSGF